MPKKAAATSTTLNEQNNVISLHLPPDRFITPFMFEQAQQEAGDRLPEGMFELSMLYEADLGTRQDHVHLECVGALPVGHYQIWRESCAGFIVAVIGEPDATFEVFNIGPFRTVANAVQAVLDHVNGQMAAWGLPSVGAEAA